MENNIKDFWDRLIPLVTIQYKTTREFCEKSDIKLQTFYNDRYYNRYPSVTNLLKMSETLGVSTDYLLYGLPIMHTLTEDEAALVQMYSDAEDSTKDIVNRILKEMLPLKDLKDDNDSRGCSRQHLQQD